MEQACTDFVALALNVLYDFRYFENQHEIFIGATNLMETNEALRTFFGLDQSRMVPRECSTLLACSRVGIGVHTCMCACSRGR